MSKRKIDELIEIYHMMQGTEKDLRKISKMFNGLMKEQNDIVLKEHIKNMERTWKEIEKESREKS